MKCSNCGNELIAGAKFCGKCGTKQEVDISPSVPKTVPIHPNFSAGEVKNKSGLFKNKSLLVLLIVAVCLSFFFLVKGTSFSPTGVWVSQDSDIEMKFHSDGKLQLGMNGTFIGDLKWEKESENIYYLSGEASLGVMDFGEIGTYAEYDKEAKTLTVDFGMGDFVFRKK